MKFFARINPAIYVVVACSLFVRQSALSEIIPQNRRTSWSAGVEGGIPSTNTWTTTNLPASSTLTQINAAIAAAAPNTILQLSAGTYNLGGGQIVFRGKNNVVLRGAGIGITTLYADVLFTAQNTTPSYWLGSALAAAGQLKNWTAGYAQGSTQITLDSVTNMSVGMMIALDQLDDLVDVDHTGLEGCSYCSRDNGVRSETQYTKVTAINGNVVTISPGVYMPNWNSSLTPQVWWAWTGNKTEMCGVENLTLNHSAGGGQHGIDYFGTMNCWVKNVASLYGDRAHIRPYCSIKTEIRHCTIQYTQNSQSQSYGILFEQASAGLAEDNIIQGCAGAVMMGAQASGNVVTYNFYVDNTYNTAPSWMIQGIQMHAGHNCMNLWEGNYGNGANMDWIHGSGSHNTFLRNRSEGWETGKGANTFAFLIQKFNHYENIVGNILGKPGYHNLYENVDGSSYPGSSIYCIGFADTVQGNGYDAQVRATLLRHGNYDTVHNGIVWDASITDHNIPPSYFYSARPPWFSSLLPWPPFDPANFAGANRLNIPAGYRFVNGVDPGGTPIPSPTPFTPTPTPSPTPSPGVTPTPGVGPNLVQTNGNNSDINLVHTVTLPSVSNHSVLLLGIRVGAGPVITSIVDTSLNSWSQVASEQIDSQGNRLYVFKVTNAAQSGPLVVTVTLTGLATGRLTILEASGCSNVTPVDQTAQATGENVSPDSGPTGTTSQPNDLLAGFIETDAGFNIISPGPGWTQQQAISISKMFLETQSVTTTGTFNATANLGGTDIWAAFCVALRGATPPSPPQGLHVVP